MYYVFKSEEITKCEDCPLLHEDENDGETMCIIADYRVVEFEKWDVKAEWCPLKPLNCWGCPKQND